MVESKPAEVYVKKALKGKTPLAKTVMKVSAAGFWPRKVARRLHRFISSDRPLIEARRRYPLLDGHHSFLVNQIVLPVLEVQAAQHQSEGKKNTPSLTRTVSPI